MDDYYKKSAELEEQIRLQEGLLQSIRDQQERDHNIRMHMVMASKKLQSLKNEYYQLERGIVDEWTGDEVLQYEPMVKVQFGQENLGAGIITHICKTHFDRESELILYVIFPDDTWVPVNPIKVAGCLIWDEALIVGEAWQ